MPIQVRIPVQLRALTGGQEVVNASGTSVLQLIEDINQQFPGVKDRICEADGKVRRFVNIFVNEEDIRFLENLQTPISEKDEVSIIPCHRRWLNSRAGGSAGVSPSRIPSQPQVLGNEVNVPWAGLSSAGSAAGYCEILQQFSRAGFSKRQIVDGVVQFRYWNVGAQV